MCELNEENLAQVSGGACYVFDVLWREYQKKNCGGCTNRNPSYCQAVMHYLKSAIESAEAKGAAVETPPCSFYRN